MAKYHVSVTVYYECIVAADFAFEAENPTGPLWDAALAQATEKGATLKVTIPDGVFTAWSRADWVHPQVGSGRLMIKDLDVHAEEI